MFDPLSNIQQGIAQQQKQIKHVQEQITRAKEEEIARQEKNNELLEVNVRQNEQMIKLKETEVDFLKSISGDTAQLVNTLNNLEIINKINGTITEANMLLIQQRLDEIISNTTPENLHGIFLNEVKKQFAERGAAFGVQMLITGIKSLIGTPTP